MDGSRTRAGSKDAVQLQQLQRHKQHLLDQNRRSLTVKTQLETQLTDLKALLLLRERELDLGRTCEGETELLERKIRLLEEENERLRGNVAALSDIDRLKSELNQAITLKTTYEEQYKAAALRALQLEQEDTNMSPIDDSQDGPGDLQTALFALSQAREERDYLRTEVIPALERSIRMHESEKNELEGKLEALRGQHRSETPEMHQLPRPKTTMKTQADQDRVQKVAFLRPKSSLSPKQQTCLITPGKLVPRQSLPKRSSLGPKPPASSSVIRCHQPLPQPQKALVKEDSFADEFPEESELL